MIPWKKGQKLKKKIEQHRQNDPSCMAFTKYSCHVNSCFAIKFVPHAKGSITFWGTRLFPFMVVVVVVFGACCCECFIQFLSLLFLSSSQE